METARYHPAAFANIVNLSISSICQYCIILAFVVVIIITIIIIIIIWENDVLQPRRGTQLRDSPCSSNRWGVFLWSDFHSSYTLRCGRVGSLSPSIHSHGVAMATYHAFSPSVVLQGGGESTSVGSRSVIASVLLIFPPLCYCSWLFLLARIPVKCLGNVFLNGCWG